MDRQTEGQTHTDGQTNQQLDTQTERHPISQPARWTDSQTKVGTGRKTDIWPGCADGWR